MNTQNRQWYTNELLVIANSLGRKIVYNSGSPAFAPIGDDLSSVKACHCCGLIHNIPDVSKRQRAVCTRCGSAFAPAGSLEQSASRTAAAAFGAFVLFWPAILLPILRIEQLGLENESSILSGVIELFHHGSYLVGTVVFVFSIILPLTKIVLLLELSMLEMLHKKHKAFTLRLMEQLGKWSMMDVMLLAFLVMLVKLGDMVEFHFGPAILAFICCVTMSMVASLSFDPHAIWEEIEDEQA